MSAVEEVASGARPNTQRFGYCQPVAVFRNPLKPLPDQPVVQAHGKDLQITQGYAEAVVAANSGKIPNVLQYLCRDPTQQRLWSLQPFAGGGHECNGAVVVAQVPAAAPGSVNCFWIGNDNAIHFAWMQGASTWGSVNAPPNPGSVPAAEYDPGKWNRYLSHLHVAYTPATPGGGGRNPVVYATQSDRYLITVKWMGNGWATTVYEGIGGGIAYNDVALVPLNEQSFCVFANVDGKSDLGQWTGTFGTAGSIKKTSAYGSTNPSGSGNGELRQIVGGAVSPTGTVCSFYTDSDSNLLTWPVTQARCSPVPVAGPGTSVASNTISTTGSRASLYVGSSDGSVWLAPQLMWSTGGQAPFFAPSSLVTGGGTSTAAVAPVHLPAELPAVGVVNTAGRLSLYSLSTQSGGVAHAGQAIYGDEEWSGGAINLSNGQPFTIDTRPFT